MKNLVYDENYGSDCFDTFAVIHCNINVLQQLFNISLNELDSIKDIIEAISGSSDVEKCDCLFFVYQTNCDEDNWYIKVMFASGGKNIDNKIYESALQFCDEIFIGDEVSDHFKDQIAYLNTKDIKNPKLETNNTEIIFKPFNWF